MNEWKPNLPQVRRSIWDNHCLYAEARVLGTFLSGHPIRLFYEDKDGLEIV